MPTASCRLATTLAWWSATLAVASTPSRGDLVMCKGGEGGVEGGSFARGQCQVVGDGLPGACVSQVELAGMEEVAYRPVGPPQGRVGQRPIEVQRPRLPRHAHTHAE